MQFEFDALLKHPEESLNCTDVWKLMKFEMSNEKTSGCLRYIGDEKLPSYMGMISYASIRMPITNQKMESKRALFLAHVKKRYSHDLVTISDGSRVNKTQPKSPTWDVFFKEFV